MIFEQSFEYTEDEKAAIKAYILSEHKRRGLGLGRKGRKIAGVVGVITLPILFFYVLKHNDWETAFKVTGWILAPFAVYVLGNLVFRLSFNAGGKVDAAYSRKFKLVVSEAGLGISDDTVEEHELNVFIWNVLKKYEVRDNMAFIKMDLTPIPVSIPLRIFSDGKDAFLKHLDEKLAE